MHFVIAMIGTPFVPAKAPSSSNEIAFCRQCADKASAAGQPNYESSVEQTQAHPQDPLLSSIFQRTDFQSYHIVFGSSYCLDYPTSLFLFSIFPSVLELF
jgi:hypothetical protein